MNDGCLVSSMKGRTIREGIGGRSGHCWGLRFGHKNISTT